MGWPEDFQLDGSYTHKHGKFHNGTGSDCLRDEPTTSRVIELRIVSTGPGLQASHKQLECV